MIDMARRIGVNYQYISQWENGRVPSLEIVKHTAEMLGEDVRVWVRVWQEAMCESIGLNPQEVLDGYVSSQNSHSFDCLPPELRLPLKRAAAKPKLYEKVVKMLEIITA